MIRLLSYTSLEIIIIRHYFLFCTILVAVCRGHGIARPVSYVAVAFSPNPILGEVLISKKIEEPQKKQGVHLYRRMRFGCF